MRTALGLENELNEHGAGSARRDDTMQLEPAIRNDLIELIAANFKAAEDGIKRLA
jgi:hypothetical protein